MVQVQQQQEQQDEPGSTSARNLLFNKYELGRLLGQGTFAKVYYARDLASDSPVAVKIIQKDQLHRHDPNLPDQIQREISIRESRDDRSRKLRRNGERERPKTRRARRASSRNSFGTVAQPMTLGSVALRNGGGGAPGLRRGRRESVGQSVEVERIFVRGRRSEREREIGGGILGFLKKKYTDGDTHELEGVDDLQRLILGAFGALTKSWVWGGYSF